jgi:competence protein ComEA
VGLESAHLKPQSPAVQVPGHGGARTGRALLGAGLASLLPPAVRAGRLAVDVRAAVALALVGAIAALLGAVYLWQARPHGTTLPPVTASRVATAAPSATGPEVVVDVQGVVRRPGVVRLPAGSRVIDAVRAAGGAAPGAATASLNLARILTDGEQVVVTKLGAVPMPGPGQAAQGLGGGAGGAGGGVAAGGGAAAPAPMVLLDLNSASLDQLDGLPGVGPVLAQRILDWRTEHGRFTSVDELREVNGIGERRFADLKGRVRV